MDIYLLLNMNKAYVFTFAFLLISVTIIHGQNIILKTQAEVDAFNPATTTITGNLTITGTGVLPANAIHNLYALSSLVNVTGTLTISDNDLLVDLGGLSHLTTIGGTLNIKDNSALANLDSLRNLQKINNDFLIKNNSALSSMELMSLDTIGRSLDIQNTAISDISGFSTLKHIGRNLTLSFIYPLTRISGFPNLISIGLGLNITENGSLQSVNGFGKLETIGGSLTINNNDKLIDLSGFASLKVIGNELYVTDNALLPNFNSFPALDTIKSNLTVFTNSKLQQLDGLSNLTYVGGNIFLENLVSLTNISGFSDLKEVKGSFTIQKNPLLINLDGLENLDSVGSILVDDNSVLNQINALSGLTSCNGSMTFTNNDVLGNLQGLSNVVFIKGNLSIDRNKLTTLEGLSNLTSVGGTFQLWNYEPLGNLEGLSKLTYIGEDFVLSPNASISWSGLSNLHSVGRDVYLNSDNLTNFEGLSGLTSIGRTLYVSHNSTLLNFDGLDSLAYIGGSLIVEGNGALKSIGPLPALDTIAEGVLLHQNFYLENIDGLAKITKLTYLEFIENSSLQNLNGLAHITSVSGKFTLSGNYKLQNINPLASLTSVGGTLRIHLNNRLKNLDSLINLTFVGGDLEIVWHDSLKEISGLQHLSTVKGNILLEYNKQMDHIGGLQNLVKVGGNLEFHANAKLKTIDGISNLTAIGGSLIVVNNGSLTKIGKFARQGKVKKDLDIKVNSKLTDCCGIQELIITYSVGRNIILSNNATGCDSVSEIIHSECHELQIYNDLNANCTHDDDENWLPGRMVTVQPGNYIFPFGGKYGLEILPDGQYTMTLDTSGPWATNCPITQNFQVIGQDIVPSLEPFGLTSTDPCSDPEVSIAMAFTRPCTDQKIYVQACNYLNGTSALTNAKVMVTLDPNLTFVSSSIPAQALGGSEYLFNPGNLSPGKCVDFSIDVQVSCDTYLGQNLCLTARLLPIDSCVFMNDPPVLNTDDCQLPYDGSNIKVSGWCTGDSVIFQVKNESNSDMTCQVPVRFYANSRFTSEDQILLLKNDIKRYAYQADSRTWRIEADQHPLHPGNSHPTVTIERCGGTALWHAGHVNERYQDDEDPFTDIYCATVTGSYDPNDKIGYPTGIGDDREIMPGQWVDYMIRFQNTGTDTAFKVVIKDTLDQDFQILSVRAGVASHPYTFNMYGQGVLEWTLDEILLPDSTTNETASHGFVTFRVDQLPNLKNGTVLENEASIYFDFNDPVITNTTRHVVDDRINSILSDVYDPEIFEKSVNFYPNPAKDQMTIELDKTYNKIEIDILNMVGIKLFSQTYLHTSSINLSPVLTPGMFILVVRADQSHIKTARFMIH